jgi:hypothetical protein
MLRRRGIRPTIVEAPTEPGRPEGAEELPTGRAIVEYRQAICPVCGASHGKRNGRNFWERTKDFDPDKPFGVVQDIGRVGKSGIRTIGYFGPDDDPDGYFPFVKTRLLQAVREWVDKGWIAPAEIITVIPELS